MYNVNAACEGALSHKLCNVGVVFLCVLLECSEVIVAHKCVIDGLVGNSYFGYVLAVGCCIVNSCVHCGLSLGLGAVELVVSCKVVACFLCAGRRVKKVDLVAVSSYHGIYIVVGDVMYPSIGNEEELVLNVAGIKVVDGVAPCSVQVVVAVLAVNNVPCVGVVVLVGSHYNCAFQCLPGRRGTVCSLHSLRTGERRCR